MEHATRVLSAATRRRHPTHVFCERHADLKTHRFGNPVCFLRRHAVFPASRRKQHASRVLHPRVAVAHQRNLDASALQFPPAHLHHPQAARARGGGAVRDGRGGFEIEAAAPKSRRCDEAAKARDARPGRRALQAPSEPEAQPASGADPASRLTRAETAVANRRSSALGGKEVGAMGRSFAIHGG